MSKALNDVLKIVGGCIPRMLEHFMTEEKLKDGLSDFLSLHEYNNTDTEDLWNTLDLFVDDQIPDNLFLYEIMDTWTKQEGYPVVVSDGTTVSQERFFLNTSGINI
jgi:aminopeptidase N